MKEFEWQHITFSDGSNPYICMTEKCFKRMKKAYNLKHLGGNFWLAKINTNNTPTF